MKRRYGREKYHHLGKLKWRSNGKGDRKLQLVCFTLRGLVTDAQNDYSGYSQGHGQDQSLYGEERRDDEQTRKGGKGPSQPFRDVIFLGLDEELTEDDVSSPISMARSRLIYSSLLSLERNMEPI